MKKNLVFLGPPGAGKGTLAAILSKDSGLVHISTGEMLRAEMKQGTELGRKAAEFVNDGKLIPDQLMADVVEKRLQEPDCQGGFILDGFPRTVPQAELLAKKLNATGMALDAVIYLTAADELLLQRLTARVMCNGCGAVYNKLFNPPKQEGTCDQCGGTEFYQREDDKIETVKDRLKVYYELTAPLIKYYEQQAVLKTISAEHEVEVIYSKLLGVLN